jgi:hypothetical protein
MAPQTLSRSDANADDEIDAAKIARPFADAASSSDVTAR